MEESPVGSWDDNADSHSRSLKVSLKKLSQRETSRGKGQSLWKTPYVKRCKNPAAAKSLQSCPTLRPHRRQPTRLCHPWDSPGKNTGVSCHFLLQCMKVKSESEVAQSCPTLSDPMDCSLPGSSTHGIFQEEYWSGVPLPSPDQASKPWPLQWSHRA